jgi:uncharacterized protein (UPF0210 family)
MKRILFIDDSFLNDNKTPRYKDIQDTLNKDASLSEIVVFMQKLPPIIETEGDRISYSCPELEDYAVIFLHYSISNVIKTDVRSYEDSDGSVISDLKTASKSTIITFSGGSSNDIKHNKLTRDDNFIVKVIEFIDYYKNNDSVINLSILFPNTKTESEINLENTHKYKDIIKDELNGSRWRSKLSIIEKDIKCLSELTNKDIMTELQSLTTPEEVRNYINSL